MNDVPADAVTEDDPCESSTLTDADFLIGKGDRSIAGALAPVGDRMLAIRILGTRRAAVEGREGYSLNRSNRAPACNHPVNG